MLRIPYGINHKILNKVGILTIGCMYPPHFQHFWNRRLRLASQHQTAHLGATIFVSQLRYCLLMRLCKIPTILIWNYFKWNDDHSHSTTSSTFQNTYILTVVDEYNESQNTVSTTHNANQTKVMWHRTQLHFAYQVKIKMPNDATLKR